MIVRARTTAGICAAGLVITGVSLLGAGLSHEESNTISTPTETSLSTLVPENGYYHQNTPTKQEASPKTTPAPLPSAAEVDQATGEEHVDYTTVDLSGIGNADGSNASSIDWGTMGPFWLRSESANLSVPLVDMGETPRNDGSNIADLNVPASYQAGWFNKSAPIDADKGTTTIMGHINYPTTDGSFKPAPMSAIYNLRVGDTVQVTSETGKLTTWKVTQSGKVDQYQLDEKYHINDRTGSRRLFLFTCDLGPDGFTFTQNHFVIAEPVTP